jgi:poly(3-hydroxybutyrate) depolymerase
VLLRGSHPGRPSTAPSLRSGLSASTIPVAGGVVRVDVPAHHTGVGVVVLHSFEHGISEPIAQGWSAAAARHRFVVVYPTRGSSWNAGLCCGAAASGKRDDVDWLATVIANVRAKYSLRTIYLTGDSNGGMMVERLVAERPNTAQRFAVWGAAPEMPTPGHWSGYGLLARGAGDTTAPPLGGSLRLGGSLTTIRPGDTTAHWLIGAHLTTRVVRGLGHAPPPNWPEVAWAALMS